MHRCPQLKTFALNINADFEWGEAFATLPMSSTLVNVQLKIQSGILDMDQVPQFWQGLGSARNLTTLKVIFSAFQEENIHPTVQPLPHRPASALCHVCTMMPNWLHLSAFLEFVQLFA